MMPLKVSHMGACWVFQYSLAREHEWSFTEGEEACWLMQFRTVNTLGAWAFRGMEPMVG